MTEELTAVCNDRPTLETCERATYCFATEIVGSRAFVIAAGRAPRATARPRATADAEMRAIAVVGVKPGVEGSGARAYWPWIQILCACLNDGDAEPLVVILRSECTLTGRILPFETG